MAHTTARRRFRSFAKLFGIGYGVLLVIVWLGTLGTGWGAISSLLLGLVLLAPVPLLLALYLIVELVFSLQQKKDPKRTLILVLLGAAAVLICAEIIGITAYRNREPVSSPPIQENLFETLGYEAYEPAYIPAGYKLRSSRAENWPFSSTKDIKIEVVHQDYLKEKTADTAASLFAIRQFRLNDGFRPSIPCSLEESDMLHLYTCDMVGHAGGYQVYAFNLKEEYKQWPEYEEISNLYVTTDNAWIDLERYGALMSTEEAMKVISSLELK